MWRKEINIKLRIQFKQRDQEFQRNGLSVRMPASANIIDGSVQREVDGFIRICTIVFA